MLGFGGGIEYDINPNLRLFGELMYEKPSFSYSENFVVYDITFKFNITAMAFNFGLKYFISMQ